MDSVPQTKRCSKCGVVKRLEDFHRFTRSKDGRQPRCRACRAVYTPEQKKQASEKGRKRREANKERYRAASRARYYAKREEIRQKQKEYYSLNADRIKENARDWRLRNIERVRERKRIYGAVHSKQIVQRVKAWVAKNTEKVKQYAKAARIKHRDRCREHYRRYKARKLSAPGNNFTEVEFKALCLRYDSRCLRCGRSDAELTADHVVPLSAGGADDIGNIQPLCFRCNASKGTKTIDYRPAARGDAATQLALF